MSQLLLFPDPRPLVERLGAAFFQQAPVCAGVYVMRDDSGAPLYVGKASNLRRRLCSYRVANPERMPRRHLRMLRAVRKIDLIECADESAASAKEAELLLAWKPKFNRAGVWPAKEQFVLWRMNEDRLDLAIADSRLDGWEVRTMFGGGAGFFLGSVARLLRCALHRKSGVDQFPAGWLRGRFRHPVTIHCGPERNEAIAALAQLFSGEAEVFCAWVQNRINAGAHCVGCNCKWVRSAVHSPQRGENKSAWGCPILRGLPQVGPTISNYPERVESHLSHPLLIIPHCVHAAILQADLEAITQYNFRP